ncbi:MAG: glycosyltransferase family 4 protein [Candidatus Margulisbacteria bacterium]|nr:glycosyltransferase family 4 protein [Candidatus Margulisiibacteriota bacterium]
MKIAMLHWGFPPIIGGVETHLVSLMPELVKMGHKVSLLTGSAEGYPEHYDFKGVGITRNQYYDLNWLFKSNFQEVDDNVWDVTLGYLNKTKPDVIHCHNMHYFSRYHTRVVEHWALQHKVPLVLTAHNAWKDKLYLDLTCKVAWDRIIAISHYIKRELVAVGVPEEKVDVVHHGIDERKFTPGTSKPFIFKDHPPLKKMKKVVFHPARLGISKGCDITIEAFRIVKNKIPDAALLMSGSGNIIDWGLTQNKDIAFFATLIKHLGLQDSVYINTFSLEKEMPELYRLADVVVYPSSAEEPFGLTMLESMAAAKPIIVTDSGGMPEIIQNDINGYVIPKGNHEALAEKIIKLLSSDKLSAKLGKTGREQIMHMYTKRIYAENIYKVFEQAIKDYSKTRKKKFQPRRKFVIAQEEMAV